MMPDRVSHGKMLPGTIDRTLPRKRKQMPTTIGRVQAEVSSRDLKSITADERMMKKKSTQGMAISQPVS